MRVELWKSSALTWLLLLWLAWFTISSPLPQGNGLVIRQEGEGRVEEPPPAAETTAPVEEEEGPRTTASVEPKETSTPTPTTREEESKPAETSSKPTETSVPAEKEEAPVTPEVNPEQLPLTPKVTPAIGFAGVLLMLSGLPYCFIGIKRRRVQIGFSAFFTVALGVVVLIIYVMKPPVSDGIQGAFLVAAVLTGCAVAGIAVVFAELVEGIGCLLGGFCLSMWFMVLKEGGLIQNGTGRIVMISALSIGVFALSFHSLTRPYALIFATSFAGATATVLGMDCFSRAGLKEFWLYIWNLNDDIFPLGTKTYPHTRGIRVEIAGIVIFSIFGILSQIRLWKVIRDHREAKEQKRLQDLADAEARDEQIGRELVERTREEREQWEAKYGAQKTEAELDEKETRGSSDSGFGPGNEIRRSPAALPPPRASLAPPSAMASTRNSAALTSSSEMENEEPREFVTPLTPKRPSAAEASRRSSTESQAKLFSQSRNGSGSSIQTRSTPSHSRQNSVETANLDPAEIPLPSSPEPPRVIPVPPVFVPDFSDNESSRAPSIRAGYVGHNGIIYQRESYNYGDMPQRSPSRIVYGDIDDRASSLDAHYDGNESCDSSVSGDSSSDSKDYGDDENPFSEDSTQRGSTERHRLSLDAVAPERKSFEEPVKSPFLDTNVAVATPDSTSASSPTSDVKQPSTEATSVNSLTADQKSTKMDSRQASLDLPRSQPRSRKTSRAPTVISSAETAATSGSLSQLHEHGAKMPKAYRTDEWAKMLKNAETPDPEALEAKRVSVALDEVPAPVDIDELLKTAAITFPPIAKRASKVSNGSETAERPRPISTASFRQRNPARVSTLPIKASMGYQPASAEVSPVQRSFSATSQIPTISNSNTLLAKRESYIRNKQTYLTTPIDEMHPRSSSPTPALTLTPQPSTTNVARTVSQQGPVPLIHRISSSGTNDDIPLSQRRDELLAAKRESSAAAPLEIRERQMRQWRESVRAEQENHRIRSVVVPLPKPEVERLSKEKKEKKAEELRKAEMAKRQQAVLEERMRMPDMIAAHQAAMRALQGQVRPDI